MDMKTLREFAEDVLNQVTTGTGYLGEIVEKAENNGKSLCASPLENQVVWLDR